MLFRSHRQPDGDADKVRQLNRMWTGLDYARLKALALRSAESAGRTPGVVVVSCGKNRDEILESVVRRGLANELILDPSAAVGLTNRLIG